MAALADPPLSDQKAWERQYFRYLIEKGAVERHGVFWQTPARLERIAMETEVIETAGFESYFIILEVILRWCRENDVITGPGRGSVGGCYVAFLMGIHEADSIEEDLFFERFLNADRIGYPDVDMDFSQEDRDKVLAFIREEFEANGQVVLQVAAFARASGRSVVDTMLNALGQDDPTAGATAHTLKQCLPEGSIAAGIKIDRELGWWLENGGTGKPDEFRAIAEQAGWLEPMLDIDGVNTHLAKHAAGVVILSEEDLERLPQTSTNGVDMMTAFDMYALDDLKYLKLDVLGLRTLDIVKNAHRFIGGDGQLRTLMQLYRDHKDDPGPYEVLQNAETVGIFQMETPGFRRTLRDFLPDRAEHLTQLGALYRPGALGYTRDEDGKNMVEVFIERRHGREPVAFEDERITPILKDTHGILLYQEQQMAVARALAGWSLKKADELRKAIGKKRMKDMAKLEPQWYADTKKLGLSEVVAKRWWDNISAAVRYSWNKSHSWFYGVITWWTIYFKHYHPAAFYTALINSYGDDREKQANVIAEARQRVKLLPPDINVAEDGFLVRDGDIVFGLNGIKGMGDSYRNEILINRMMEGEFSSYEDFAERLPSTPINLKRSLVACGAFDGLGEDRARLLATIPKSDKATWIVTLECGCKRKSKKEPPDISEIVCGKAGPEHEGKRGIDVEEVFERWEVIEHIGHNRKLKKPKELPTNPLDYEFPTDAQLATGEMEAMGYYISSVPLAAVNEALSRCTGNVYGGEVESVRTKNDKNENEMAWITLVTPALTKLRVMMFASTWQTFHSRVEKGAQLLFRGRQDGDQVIADVCWAPDDVRHFKKIKVWKEGDEGRPQAQDFDGRMETIRDLESHGYSVRLL